ncbi:MarR family transcriptional regulator [Bacillus atrophaeus]|uniref:MarR family winged helix-turn-helix transcriptional regulator n=1 Tax=Bacillus atrophaeus TaxID=1452 RepID=UPI00228296EB|nr:MarR family transcriptional regulator [Bacillus atrophaeus]MCY7946243.1 MarR family transcriptional regulator [Bacillus atrophaeus]MCY8096864.1 MarR family transcriptional regulator [Bacillus atrophaeus]MCY9169480.1 MarR family transcriptional regulator [Bacillus atrophaeus]MEC0740329.1 MarR family transcriptional regulator [Bacillus atrophaeus]MEC0746005.1 MarR family transcriptional regulator [Bacillus atrophaeus]
MDKGKQGIMKDIIHTQFEVNRAVRKKLFQTERTITPTQMYMLSLLDKGETSTVSELRKRLDLTSGAATIAINRLIEGQYIKRERDQGDRRVVRLSMTDKGMEIYQKLNDQFQVTYSQLFKDFSAEELEQFLVFFNRMKEQTML